MMKLLKVILITGLIVFVVIVSAYIFNYELSMQAVEFRKECEIKDGVVIHDEHGDAFCLHRDNKSEQTL